jgi:hypothetical protein
MSATDRRQAQFEAATYLFEMTGEAQFKEFADANYGAILPPWGASMWEVDALESLLYYAELPGATHEVAKAIRERFLTNLSRASDAFQGSLQRVDPYRAPIEDIPGAAIRERPGKQGCISWRPCTARIQGCPRSPSLPLWNMPTISMA